MKILQRKILVLVVSSVLISALFIMSIAFFNYDRIVESDSRQIMQLMCSAQKILVGESSRENFLGQRSPNFLAPGTNFPGRQFFHGPGVGRIVWG